MRARRIKRRGGAAHIKHVFKPMRRPAHFIANLAACVKAGKRASGCIRCLRRASRRPKKLAPLEMVRTLPILQVGLMPQNVSYCCNPLNPNKTRPTKLAGKVPASRRHRRRKKGGSTACSGGFIDTSSPPTEAGTPLAMTIERPPQARQETRIRNELGDYFSSSCNGICAGTSGRRRLDFGGAHTGFSGRIARQGRHRHQPAGGGLDKRHGRGFARARS